MCIMKKPQRLNLSELNLGPVKRPYVVLMLEIIGRGLEAASQVDEKIRREVERLPPGFMFEMRVLPNGPRMVMEKTEQGQLQYLGRQAPRTPDVSLKFKHLTHAFLVFSFQEGTAQAFANDRLLLDGDIGYSMKLVRCLNRMESMILPKFVAQRALKRYPTLSLPEKLLGGSRIYSRLAKNLVWN